VLDKFDGLELSHIPRKYNEEADELAKIASGRTTVSSNIFARDLAKSSVDFQDPAESGASPAEPSDGNPLAGRSDPTEMEIETETSSANMAEAMQIDEAPPRQDWHDQYLDWINGGVLPSDRAQARRVARRAKSFVLIDRELYKRSPSGILQRCIPIPEGRELLWDIHAGACGHHADPCALVGNEFRKGFYWPRTVADATEIVRTCEGCQFYARQTHLPTHALQTIPITWPFAVWGLDLIGPLQKAPGGYTHLLVAIDKFSKWIEARPIIKIKFEQAVQFFTNIIYRFGVPNSIIKDNGTQFTGKKFLEFCDDYHIRVDWSAVAHPQTNGQVERANGMILQDLKPRIFNKLNKFGQKWLTELPSVIWSLRTTPSRATGFSPFFLVYGAEAVLPTDLEYGFPRLKAYQEQRNQQAREDSLNQVDEARDVALLHSAHYQQSLR